MADTKISDMTPATQVKNADKVEIEQSGDTFSATAEQIRGYTETYDISAGNQTETLPDAATYPGLKFTAIVTGGDGTFDFQWVTTDDLIRDGNIETPAHEAVQGEGVTTVIAKGGDWVTVEYEDYLAVSGTSAGGDIKKTLSEMVISHLDSTTYTTTITLAGVYRSAGATYTYPKAFTANPHINVQSEQIAGICWGAIGAITTTTVSISLVGGSNSTTGHQGYTARGKW